MNKWHLRSAPCKASQIDLVATTNPESKRSKSRRFKEAVKSNLLQLILRQRAVIWLIHKYFHNDVKHI